MKAKPGKKDMQKGREVGCGRAVLWLERKEEMLRCNLKAIPCYARDYMCGPNVGHVDLLGCQALLLDRVDTFLGCYLVKEHAQDTQWLSN